MGDIFTGLDGCLQNILDTAALCLAVTEQRQGYNRFHSTCWIAPPTGWHIAVERVP